MEQRLPRGLQKNQTEPRESPSAHATCNRKTFFLYMTVLDESMGCVLGQHDDSGKKEQAIYYLSKKFTACEMNYSMLERTCCALVWASHRLK